ncbi:MAG: hypothetical protein ACQETI_14700 [Halobacteriota archaeon]
MTVLTRSGAVLDVVDADELLGIDGTGAAHLYDREARQVTVRDVDSEDVEAFTVSEASLERWIRHVEDVRRWVHLRTRYHPAINPRARRPGGERR